MSYKNKPRQIFSPTLIAARKQIKLASLSLCVSLLTSACFAANEPTQKAVVAPTVSEKNQAVESEGAEMASDTYCESALDCAFVPMGQRACGGPSSYKIYSTRIGDKAISKLQQLSSESVALAKQTNQQSGLSSTCQIEPLPSLSCVENQCVKNESPNLTY